MRTFLLILFLAFSLSAENALEKSIASGVDYLIKNQNPDGSWGTPGRTKSLNIYAPGPGAHIDFKTAVTALDLLALCRLPKKTPEINKAIEKSLDYLLKEYLKVKRVDGRWVGNNWSHAYIIKAFLEARGLDFLSAKKSKMDEVIRHQLGMLKEFQYIDGGWGYYDFDNRTNKPSGKSTSFLIATVLITLKDAEKAGFKIDQAMVEKGIGQLKKQRRPDGNFLYSYDFNFYPGRSINRTQGSLGRIHGCMRALYDWQDSVIKSTDFEPAFTNLIKLNGWLDIVRKRPVPHEGWYKIAGYFYYYGHFYAAENLPLLENKRKLAGELSEILISKQEKSGAWFDFPLYDYGHYYGTGYVLMSLIRCQQALAE